FAVLDRVYDAANRLIEELSPQVQLFGSLARVLTRFTYDANGNRTSTTVAAGTADAGTEYAWYDADNRRVALVNRGRTLHLFAYDANGNQTGVTRFITKVPGGLDL